MITDHLTQTDIECVKAYADHDMRATAAGAQMYVHKNTVVFHLEKVKRITGLNPRKFYDLVKLLRMLEGEA